MEEHILVQGRLNSNLYKLYYTEHPEVVEQIKEELAEMGYEEAGPSFYLGAANYKFVHVPSDRPEEYSTTGWLSLIVDTYEHIVYYGDPNKYHNSVIEGIEDLNGTGANDSFSLGDYDRWIPGEYNLTSGNVAFFAQKLTDKSQADLNLRYTIQQYFGAEETPLKVTRVENPWHILRKPFVYNEETNTLIIGEAGTGFLYDSSFTLDTQVPNAVKEALVKLTINQARPMEEDDEGFPIDYWTEQPNYVWWTS